MTKIILVYLLIGAIYACLFERDVREIEKQGLTIRKYFWYLAFIAITLWPACITCTILVRIGNEKAVEQCNDGLEFFLEEIEEET